MFSFFNRFPARTGLLVFCFVCLLQVASAAEFDVFDAGAKTQVGLIEIPCEPGTMIFIDGKYLLVSKSEKGVLLVNVSAGTHVVRTKPFAGGTTTYTLEVKEGDVASTVVPKEADLAPAVAPKTEAAPILPEVAANPKPALGKPEKLAPAPVAEVEPKEEPAAESRILSVADDAKTPKAATELKPVPAPVAEATDEDTFKLERTIRPGRTPVTTEPEPMLVKKPESRVDRQIGPVLPHSEMRGWNRLKKRPKAAFLISIEPMGIWSNPKADRFYTYNNNGSYYYSYQRENMDDGPSFMPAFRMGVGINSPVVDTDILFGFGRLIHSDFDAPYVDLMVAPRFNLGAPAKIGPIFGLMSFGEADLNGDSDIALRDGAGYRIGAEACLGHRGAKFKAGISYIRMHYDVDEVGNWRANKDELDLSGIYVTLGLYLRL